MALHTVVVGALVRDGTVLLCHRSPTRRWYPNVWDFPGGHVEAGESALDALSRELQEELGIDQLTVELDPILTMVDEELEFSLWVVTEWRGTIVNRQSDEHDELRWFAGSDLGGLALADPSYAEVLDRLLA